MAWERQWDYNQGKDKRLLAMKETQGGACYALSMYWIVNWAKGINYLEWLSPPLEASSKGNTTFGVGMVQNLRKIMENQNKFLSYQTVLGKSSRNLKLGYAKIMIEGNCILRSTRRLVIENNASLDQIASNIADAEGYVMLGWYKSDFGGHACAAHVGPAEVFFFDPNFGQYWFDSKSSFKTWYRSYMCMNYRLNKGLDEAGTEHYR